MLVSVVCSLSYGACSLFAFGRRWLLSFFDVDVCCLLLCGCRSVFVRCSNCVSCSLLVLVVVLRRWRVLFVVDCCFFDCLCLCVLLVVGVC